MEFYGIDAQGKVKIERVDDLPAWTPDCEGRVLIVRNKKSLYYGTDEGWNTTAGSGFHPVWIDDNYTASPQDLILVDSSKKSLTIDMPPVCNLGSQIVIIDALGIFESNPVIINRNGNTIQKFRKDLILDINDIYITFTFDPKTAFGWKLDIGGTCQVVGNVTLFVHRAQLAADLDGQKEFVLPFIYNPSKNNIAVYVNGIKDYTFEKTNNKAITLKSGVPKGTVVEVSSIPLDDAYNIDDFISKDDYLSDIANYLKIADLLPEIKKVHGTGSGIDADMLDTYHASAFVFKTNYKDIDILNKIKNVDGYGSGLDADRIQDKDITLMASPDKLVYTHSSGEYSGKLDPSVIPFGRNIVEFVDVIDVTQGDAFIDIMDLNNQHGYVFYMINVTPMTSNVDMYAKIYNRTTVSWAPFSSQTVEYTSHVSGPQRDFNTDLDLLVCRKIGNGEFGGVNSNITSFGLSIAPNSLLKSVTIDSVFTSPTESQVSYFKSIGTMLNNGHAYNGLRFYLSSGAFYSGKILIGKINDRH